MKLFALFTCILLLTNASFAQDTLGCGADYVCIITADAVPSVPTKLDPDIPYTPKVAGWFFPADVERTIRLRLMDADYMEKRLGLQDTLIKELTEQSSLNERLSKEYSAAYAAELRAGGRSKLLFFALGALTVIAGGIALGYASHAIK